MIFSLFIYICLWKLVEEVDTNQTNGKMLLENVVVAWIKLQIFQKEDPVLLTFINYALFITQIGLKIVNPLDF